MSTMSVDTITHPSQFRLPPEAQEVLGNLTDVGRREFIREVLDALAASTAADDLRPLADVIEAWYRTMIVRLHACYEDQMAKAAEPSTAEIMGIVEVRRRLGV